MRDARSGGQAADPDAKFHAAISKLSETGIPIGWDDAQIKVLDLDRNNLTVGTLWKSIQGHIGVIASLILGWFITALAASLGAPFWFDLLGRFMNVRNAGKLPGEKESTSTAGKLSASLNSTPGTGQ
jgi:hypothetical protein